MAVFFGSDALGVFAHSLQIGSARTSGGRRPDVGRTSAPSTRSLGPLPFDCMSRQNHEVLLEKRDSHLGTAIAVLK